MKNYRFAALVGALAFACLVVAWLWYERAGSPRSSAPAPVQAITAAPVPSVTPSKAPHNPLASPAATQAPVVFIPQSAAPVSTSVPRIATLAPGATSTPTPLEAATHAPDGAPMPVVTLAPSAALPGVVKEPPNAPPRILALSISTPVAHGGDVVSGFVETSSNVASVEARIAGYSSSMRKIGVGKFALTYRVPRLPFFLHRTYSIQVIARNTRGDAVTSAVPITIR
jgi:hypothetical protein